MERAELGVKVCLRVRREVQKDLEGAEQRLRRYIRKPEE